MSGTAPFLVLDSASPLVSVAVGRGAEAWASRAEPIERSSRRLLEMIDEVLRETGLRLADLAGIAALQGPGSFTGLRIGLATVLGFHQALGLPATALPTLPILASLAGGGRSFGACDALRGEWMVQGTDGGARLLGEAALAELASCTLVGFGISRLGTLPGWPEAVRLQEPTALAPPALAAEFSWDPGRLTAPIYSRPPAVTPSRRR